MKYIKLIRPHHYVKNGLILLPLFFSGRFFEMSLAASAALGFLAFCLISSAVYVMNDIRDIEEDRQHPTKKNRPLASGQVSRKAAIVLLVLLVCGALGLQLAATGFACPLGWFWLILYFLLNLGYSLGLKNTPIIDVAILSSGFLIRVLYGSAITGIEVSHWLYLTVLTMSFFLGLGKRRNELTSSGEAARKVLTYYTAGFLSAFMYVFLGLTIAFYSLWCVDPVTVQRMTNDRIIWTVPIVVLICMKYSLNIESSADGDPVEVLLRDKVLLVLSALYLAVTVALVYI